MTIVVLGGGISSEGEIPDQSKRRLQKAKEIFKKKKEKPNILLCGKYSFLYPKDKLPPITEAKAMKKKLLKFGIPEEKIFLEEKSQDTISNAYYAKKEYFIPQKERKAIIISSSYHIPRLEFIFKKVFGPEYNLKFMGIASPFSEKEIKELENRQKELLQKTKKIMKEMEPGNHEFLKDIFFNIDYYKEQRPKWVIKKVVEGK